MGPQGWSWWAENLLPTGIRSQITQPIVSRYTDWATQSTVIYVTYTFFLKVLGYIIRLTFVAFHVHEFDSCQSLWLCRLQRGSVATHWDCGFESCQWHGCLFLVSVVCCAGTSPCIGSIPHPQNSTKCVYVCVCVCMCHWMPQKPLHSQWVLERSQTKKESLTVHWSQNQLNAHTKQSNFLLWHLYNDSKLHNLSYDVSCFVGIQYIQWLLGLTEHEKTMTDCKPITMALT